MNNIEKLAIEHGVITKAGVFGFEHSVYIFGLEQLESFAKALQSSEPVALPTFNELSKNIDDSRFVGHPKLSALDTNNVKTGAQIMYDAIYVWLQKQNTSSTVPLEKYNKLLDALKVASRAINYAKDNVSVADGKRAYHDDIAYYLDALKAIAEAEGKEG